jgi:hypothetical protein
MGLVVGVELGLLLGLSWDVIKVVNEQNLGAVDKLKPSRLAPSDR